MPDGPRYDEDFYAWTRYQAEVLRALRTDDNRFDRENVAEEIESSGNSQRDAARSHVPRIIEHLLKMEYSPAADPRYGWMRSIVEARATLGDLLSATLRRDLEATLPKLYRDARQAALLSLLEYGEGDAAAALPPACGYTLDDILRDDWYIEPQEATK
ncbi:MAG TPA: DUF29 domain-containing protein [Stellaceae bacterium]|nr:DUF29 domain-containing protein [Stellaceae bacterium]